MSFLLPVHWSFTPSNPQNDFQLKSSPVLCSLPSPTGTNDLWPEATLCVTLLNLRDEPWPKCQCLLDRIITFKSQKKLTACSKHILQIDQLLQFVYFGVLKTQTDNFPVAFPGTERATSSEYVLQLAQWIKHCYVYYVLTHLFWQKLLLSTLHIWK